MAGEGFDPVGIAFANAARPEAEIQQNQQRQNQLAGQVLQFAGQQDQRNNANQAFADRAASRTQDQAQFDVVQHLREQQFGLQQQQAYAQIAAINSEQQLRGLELQQKTKQINEAPYVADAQSQLYGILGQAQTPEDLQTAYGQIAQTPAITKFIPAAQINQSFLDARQNIAQTKLAQTTQAQNIKNMDAVAEYQDLGGDPSVHADTDGKIDYTSLRNDLGVLKQQQAQTKLDADTQSKIQVGTATIQAKAQAYLDRLQNDGKLSDVDKERVRIAVDRARKSYDPNESQNYFNQADQILSSQGTTSIQTAPSSTTPVKTAINPKTGETLQLINGKWQPTQ